MTALGLPRRLWPAAMGRCGWPTPTRGRWRASTPRTHAVVETLPVGSSPSGIAVGAGAVWVTDNLGQSVSRVDPAVDRVVQTIPVGNGPEGVAVGEGAVWVANSSDGTLSRIDPVTGACGRHHRAGRGRHRRHRRRGCGVGERRER